MRKILSSAFFDRPTLAVAKDLLGKFLVRKIGRRDIEGMIAEVEAYVGPNDRASHASRGRTERNGVMFGPAGYWYVYLVYGMHHCLNIVTEREGYPAAVLIRSVTAPKCRIYQRSLVNATNRIYKRLSADAESARPILISGPGRVCKYFKIDRTFNKKPAAELSRLWIEDRGIKINPRRIRRGRRIGVEYAREWKEKLWRFSLLSIPEG